MSLTVAEFSRRVQPVVMPDLDAVALMLYWSYGLGGEAGAFQNEIKKIVREGKLPEQAEGALLMEAGQVLFYLTLALRSCGLTLDEAAADCLRHLEELRMRG